MFNQTAICVPKLENRKKSLFGAPPKSTVPAHIKRMKATLFDEPFDETGRLSEVKWVRCSAIASISKKMVRN